MNTTKSFKIYNFGYTFKVQTVLKTNKHNNFEYFDQIILMQTRKLMNFQARVSTTYVTIFTQGKEITRNDEILVIFFLSKQYYVIKKQDFRKILKKLSNDIHFKVKLLKKS